MLPGGNTSLISCPSCVMGVNHVDELKFTIDCRISLPSKCAGVDIDKSRFRMRHKETVQLYQEGSSLSVQ